MDAYYNLKENNYLLWLSRINGLGIKAKHVILNSFKSPAEIFFASKYKLSCIEGLTEQNINDIIKAQDEGLINKYSYELKQKGLSFVGVKSPVFPTLLREISDSPIGLYVSGKLPDNDMPFVSIIGSRKCSEYGLSVAYKLSKDLAKSGVVIVSGMARGIDSMAHKGALDGGGLTVAVMGCGADVCYPSENKALRDRIIESGCVISEYPPETTPMPAYFPQRNRIISGLSSATIVVEAAKRSGTLITVSEALDQGREVMAVPGNVTSKLSQGTNELIKDGAVVVSTYKDVLDALGIVEKENNQEENKNNIIAIKALAPNEQLVYACIGNEPVHADVVIEKACIDTQTATYVLTMLEIKGHIKKLAGNRYIKNL